MITVCDLLTGYIESKEGSSVSAQFECTFNGSEGFDEQNYNALKYILPLCKNVQKSELLNDNSELDEYIENLSDFLQKEKANN